MENPPTAWAIRLLRTQTLIMLRSSSITQNEIPFPVGCYLVSKTDLKGNITHANDAFVDVSGFGRAELIGKSHNIVRHPDMPAEAFSDLWRTVRNGYPWRGIVKNRCKNGNFYWVKALVVPVRSNGDVTGYMSVRTAPSRGEIQDADARYRRVRERRGALPRTGEHALDRLPFVWRIWGVTGTLALLMATIACLSLFGEPSASMVLAIGGAAAAATLFALGIGLYLVWNIDHPLSRIATFFTQIAEGNLTNEIDVSRRDETGILSCQLASMQVQLLAMLDEIANAAAKIETRCQDLTGNLEQVNEHSTLQYDSAKSVAAATEQLSVSVREVAHGSQDATASARKAQQLIDAGNGEISAAVDKTRRVVTAVSRSHRTVEELSVATERIGTITQVIKDVAGQTNLLALNAAIEAARAGDRGRGFAVVADEVRALAERTAKSTRDISETIETIQSVTTEAVAAMESARQEVETSIASLTASTATLNNVTQAATDVTAMSRSISDATVEQAQASNDVAKNMERITQLIESNLSSAENAKQSAIDLLGTSAALKHLIGGFKLYKV
jgi:aerotaxis receptor